MKYTINAQIHFDDFTDANVLFGTLEKLQPHMTNINEGDGNNEDSYVRLIKNDHDEINRNGSILLSTINKDEIKIINKDEMNKLKLVK